MVGIVSYGAYIPKGRIKIAEIARVWGKSPEEITRSLGIEEKAIASFDEDAATMAVEAAWQAIRRAKIPATSLEAVYIGSESHPYAVNPTSTIVGETLGLGNDYLSADLEFACKAGSAGMQVVWGLIESKKIKLGLAVGSDSSQAKPHDALEFTAGAGAAAYVLGINEKDWIAKIIDFVSFSSDTPDFWRRDGISYPTHSGRFTGEPAYFCHVLAATQKLLQKTKLTPSDFDHCVFHMPNGKFPREVAARIGFSPKQLEMSLIVDKLGNPYSASSLLGLAAVLDQAKPEKRIFFCSYGSGAGSDAFIFETTRELVKRRESGKSIGKLMAEKRYISYVEYLKQTRKL